MASLPVEPRWYRLDNTVQPYAWGCRGAQAFIPRLLGCAAVADQPFAELWMGAHPSAPSRVVVGEHTLSLRDWVAADPGAVLGQPVAAAFDGAFPFLFKVLSAADVLSIQAHPNREQARQLHARDPDHYPDANHKPELAVALGDFRAMVGFRSFSEIQSLFRQYPPLTAFVGEETVAPLLTPSPARARQRDLLRASFTALIRGAAERPASLARAVAALARHIASSGPRDAAEALFLDLRARYEDTDVGLLILFFLNQVHLQAGEGLFLPAGVPHAYISGNIVECMANSDNVVRAGLTPKFKDAETLVEILRYEPGPPPILSPVGAGYGESTREFRVNRWVWEASAEAVPMDGGRVQILLVIQGRVVGRWPGGEMVVSRGQAVLVPGCLARFDVQAVEDTILFGATAGV